MSNKKTKGLKLYHISQSQNSGWDTTSDMVVCATSEDDARLVHPDDFDLMDRDPWTYEWSSWCKSPDQVEVVYIGVAAPDVKPGIVCASFHAG